MLYVCCHTFEKNALMNEMIYKPDVRINNPIYLLRQAEELIKIAKSKGFLLVSSSPLTRSSYHADEDFTKLQQNRINNH